MAGTKKCVLFKKSQAKKFAAKGAKADPGTVGIMDNEDGSFSVTGVDAQGFPVDITDVATLAVTSDNTTVLTVDAPQGMKCVFHGLTPGTVSILLTVTANDGSFGPYNFALLAECKHKAGPVVGIEVTLGTPVPR